MVYAHDPLIQYYIENNYNEVQQKIITDSFTLFATLEYQDFEDAYIDILSREGYRDPLSILDMFWNRLHRDLRYVLETFTVLVNTDIPASKLTEMIHGLSTLPHLEDYTEIQSILADIEQDTLSKLAHILPKVSTLSIHDIYDIVAKVDDTLVETLGEYIEELTNITDELDESLILSDANIKLYKQLAIYAKDYTPYGIQLLKEGVLYGQPISVYLQDLSLTNRDTAELTLDIYSIIILHDPSTTSILETYTDKVAMKIIEIDLQLTIGNLLIQLVGNLDGIEVPTDG